MFIQIPKRMFLFAALIFLISYIQIVTADIPAHQYNNLVNKVTAMLDGIKPMDLIKAEEYLRILEYGVADNKSPHRTKAVAELRKRFQAYKENLFIPTNQEIEDTADTGDDEDTEDDAVQETIDPQVPIIENIVQETPAQENAPQEIAQDQSQETYDQSNDTHDQDSQSGAYTFYTSSINDNYDEPYSAKKARHLLNFHDAKDEERKKEFPDLLTINDCIIAQEIDENVPVTQWDITHAENQCVCHHSHDDDETFLQIPAELCQKEQKENKESIQENASHTQHVLPENTNPPASVNRTIIAETPREGQKARVQSECDLDGVAALFTIQERESAHDQKIQAEPQAILQSSVPTQNTSIQALNSLQTSNDARNQLDVRDQLIALLHLQPNATNKEIRSAARAHRLANKEHFSCDRDLEKLSPLYRKPYIPFQFFMTLYNEFKKKNKSSQEHLPPQQLLPPTQSIQDDEKSQSELENFPESIRDEDLHNKINGLIQTHGNGINLQWNNDEQDSNTTIQYVEIQLPNRTLIKYSRKCSDTKPNEPWIKDQSNGIQQLSLMNQSASSATEQQSAPEDKIKKENDLHTNSPITQDLQKLNYVQQRKQFHYTEIKKQEIGAKQNEEQKEKSLKARENNPDLGKHPTYASTSTRILPPHK